MYSLYNLTKRVLLAVAVVHLVALTAVWLIGRPAQAASTASPNPAPTESVVDTPVRIVPTAMPLAPIVPTQVAQTAAPLQPTVAAGANGVNVRSGPSTDFDKIGYLEPGAQAEAIGRYGDWWQIEYAGAPAWVAGWVVNASNIGSVPQVEPPVQPTAVPAAPTVIPAPAAPSDIHEERWIDVDLTHQTLTAYENGEPVHSTLVSTGLPQTPTPTGQFRIWIKLRYDDMQGVGYYLKDVPFVMYFYQGYGLHGVTWHGNFGHPMSRGCVNLPVSEAEWLFSFADVGTLVNIHD